MFSFSEFQAEARKIFGAQEYHVFGNNPISFLYSLEWNIPNSAAFSEEDVARMKLRLDERGCFGRAVRGAVLVEKYFPKETIYFAEVYEDLLRNMLMKKVTKENWNDDTYIAEILQYEKPHAVIVWNDLQFDPIFKFLDTNPEKLKHPSIGKHDLWNALYASYLVSFGVLKFRGENEPKTYLHFLQQAGSLCPDMVLIKENRASALCAIESFYESISISKQLLGKRKDVKMLFFLWLLTNEASYKNQIIKQYDVALLYRDGVDV